MTAPARVTVRGATHEAAIAVEARARGRHAANGMHVVRSRAEHEPDGAASVTLWMERAPCPEMR